ncbi:MAG: hypothetical protein R3301_04785, partial [Saprospiraceae bacterium]|nr:hypothetical protein [Saprospiraceae bacterium]
ASSSTRMSLLRHESHPSRHRTIFLNIRIPPIRTDVQPPYDLQDYEKFKQEIEEIAAGHECVQFANFEEVVQPGNWGMKGSTIIGDSLELDFMHFSFEGHKELARALKGVL